MNSERLPYHSLMKIKQLESPTDIFDLRLAKEKPFDVVGFGTNSVDHLCFVDEYPPIGSKSEIVQHEKLPGGQVATALEFLSRIGLKTKYVGKVGGDELGRFCLRNFASGSVDTTSVLVEQTARNQYAFIIVDRMSGERTVLSRRESGLNFREHELNKNEICAGRILHLDGYDSAGSLKAAKWCRQFGIPVSIDLDKVVHGCPELIKNVDFLIASSNFPSEFTGIADPCRAFRELRKCYEGFLAVTLGSLGAMAWVGNQCVRFPGLEVNAVDTTGAGDIFHAAFIYGLLQNWPLGKTMSFANAAAGLSCKFIGAQAGIRPISEILQHVDRVPSPLRL